MDREAITVRTDTGCGTMFMIFDFNEDGVLSGVSIKIAKPGVCANTQALAHTCSINLMLDHGIPINLIADKFNALNDCQQKLKEGLSCPRAIAKLLRRLLENNGKG